jgi:hypothetical protein
MDSMYDLYRYFNPDGTSKDWAIRNNGNGTYTKRWGKTGTRLQSKEFPYKSGNEILKDTGSKVRKGYGYVGKYHIDDGGNMSTVPLASSTPTANKPNPAQEDPRIYWRIKIPDFLPVQPVLQYFKDKATDYAQSILGFYPDCEWVIALKSRYRDMAYVKPDAGFFKKEDGVAPLLLLLALKKAAPDGITVSLSHDDQVEISAQLKKEAEALSFFGTDLESIRSIAEIIGLLEKKLDLSLVTAEVEDYYF